jgi:hypothetical protein
MLAPKKITTDKTSKISECQEIILMLNYNYSFGYKLSFDDQSDALWFISLNQQIKGIFFTNQG